jgi:elongation factor P
MQVSTAEFRRGLKIELDGQPYNIVEFQHVKPGKGGAFVRTKLKHLRLGRVVDKTFRAGEKVGLVDYEQRSMQYLYKDDNFHFMNLETFEQIALPPDVVGEAANWLKETMEVDVYIINGVPAGVDVPNFVELEVVKTDPGLRGDTASGGSKPATLETGAVVQVPLFIDQGEMLRIDTRTGAYIERA